MVDDGIDPVALVTGADHALNGLGVARGHGIGQVALVATIDHALNGLAQAQRDRLTEHPDLAATIPSPSQRPVREGEGTSVAGLARRIGLGLPAPGEVDDLASRLGPA